MGFHTINSSYVDMSCSTNSTHFPVTFRFAFLYSSLQVIETTSSTQVQTWGLQHNHIIQELEGILDSPPLFL